MHTLIIGAGFSGLEIARQASALGTVAGTRQSHESLTARWLIRRCAFLAQCRRALQN